MSTVMAVGQSIGPLLTGWMVGMAGYSNAFTLLATILLLTVMLLGLLFKEA